jgi:NitT/TauT family transport system substrate-binding protein/putative hydroxymethylpyrimidine transport system substrate-binding protein
MRRLLLLLVVGALVGCGGSSEESGPVKLTLALDFTPNAVHAPLYAALDHDRAHGIELEIRQPGSGPDALKLVSSGKAQLGVLDIHDLAIAREQGADLVAIAALVERPLAALAARPGVERPRDLEGRTIGVSGLPSDPAFVRAIVEHDGGDADQVHQVTIGFSAVTRLLSGRVDAAPVFWNAEGVALKRAGLDINEFRVDDYGAPPYPEVVLFTAQKTLDEQRPALTDALAAIADGLEDVRRDPDASVDDIAAAAQTKDTGLVRAQLRAVEPLFGLELDDKILGRWAAFDADIGIVNEPPDVGAAFEPLR